MENLFRSVTQRIAQGLGVPEEVRTGGRVVARAGESIVLGSDPARATHVRPYMERGRLVRVADVPAGRISRAAVKVDVDLEGKIAAITSLTDRNDVSVYVQEATRQEWVGGFLAKRTGAPVPGEIAGPLARAQRELSATQVVVNIESGTGARMHLIMNPGKTPQETLDIVVRKGALQFTQQGDRLILDERHLRI